MRPIEKEVTEDHMLLLRDLSQIVHDFHRSHPEIDVLEIVAVIGGLAGAVISSAPTETQRGHARMSVIATMDQTIIDFVVGRKNGA